MFYNSKFLLLVRYILVQTDKITQNYLTSNWREQIQNLQQKGKSKGLLMDFITFEMWQKLLHGDNMILMRMRKWSKVGSDDEKETRGGKNGKRRTWRGRENGYFDDFKL